MVTLVRSAVLAGAAAIMFAGLWTAPEPPEVWRLVLAVCVVGAAQLMPVRYRAGARVVSLFWGETALIINLYLLPAGWVPFAFALGTGASQYLLWHTGRRASPQRIPPMAAHLALAAAAGALVATAVADPSRIDLTPRLMLGLVLGCLAYLLVTTGVVGILTAHEGRTSGLSAIWLPLRRKAVMFVGNVAVGLSVLAVLSADWRALAALPVVFWLLHRTYRHRLELAEDRRLWTTLAEATRSLNQPEEASVATAGVRGALDVFAVGRAEVVLGGPPHARRVWVGDQTGDVRRLGFETPPVDDRPRPTTVPLLVGGEEVGRLRVFFPRDAGPSDGDRAALQTYGDALAAALRDTVTHQELHQLLARSRRDAQHDPLTGLFNRSALLTRGETALQLASHADPVALLLVDVNHFREVNDTLGHAAGDEVLKVTAERLRDAVGPGPLVARLGADEFAVLVTGVSAGAGPALPRAVARGRELVERLAVQADVRGVALAIEATVGVVVAPAGTADMMELLRRADSALRVAKQDGTAVAWYDSAGDAGDTDRLALLAELRAALSRDDELVLMLQPVVDLSTGAPIELEALVRWHHPRRGVLAPADFVRAVEHSELLGTFTEYVIDRALEIAGRWARHGPPIPVAVNLSARSLLDPRLSSAVAALLHKHRVPGRRLVLEITETLVMSELPGIEEALARLRALGVRLAVDDFGTGYASLTFLTRVRLDEVKIDRSFVTTMAESAEAEAIIRATVELGRDLGLRVVAEGVENESQRLMLRALGCTAGQGFHFVVPVPADRLGDLLPGAGEVLPLSPSGTPPS